MPSAVVTTAKIPSATTMSTMPVTTDLVAAYPTASALRSECMP